MADVEKAVDEIAAILRLERVGLSQRRKSMVCLGLPDRRYRCRYYLFAGQPRLAFWFECKSPTDRLSEEQRHFLVSELECGAVAGVGGRDELEQLFIAYRQGGLARALQVGEEQVRAWIAKGLRK